MRKLLTAPSGDFSLVFCAIITVLLALLCDTPLMAAEATEKCR